MHTPHYEIKHKNTYHKTKHMISAMCKTNSKIGLSNKTEDRIRARSKTKGKIRLRRKAKDRHKPTKDLEWKAISN